MKKIFLMFGLSILVCTASFAQSPYQLEVEQHVSDTVLFLDFYIKKTSGADFKLGSSNFAVFITIANLKADRMFKVDSLDGIWNMSFDPNSYLQSSVGGNGFVNLTVYRRTAGSGAGQPVTATRGRIGRVGIPISNSCGTNTCSWIITPVAINNFADQSIKSSANFIAPTANFSLCAAPPAPVLAAAQGTIICPSQPIILQATATLAPGQKLEWYRNNQLIASASQSSYLATQAGTYSVRTARCISCASTFQTLNVQEMALPAMPTITQVADTLLASNGQNYKWYHNNQLIAGATAARYLPTQAGTYKVCSSNQCGQVYSSEFLYAPLGLASSQQNQFKAQVFPNPYTAGSVLILEVADKNSCKIEIFNATSQRVAMLSPALDRGKNSIALGNALTSQPAGTYFITIKQNDKTQTLKIVKSN